MATEAILEPNLTKAVPFFRVEDMEASLRFYVDGLGFRPGPKWVVEGEIRWCWLSRGDVVFMIETYRPQGAKVPAAVRGEGFSICVMCEDAIALYHELKGRGIPASRPFVGNGLWVTTVTDPDGFRIDFESPTDAPEDTEYGDGSLPAGNGPGVIA